MVDKFYVDKKVHPLIEELVKKAHSPFYKKDMKDVFIFSMAIGFILKKRKELQKKKDVADVDVFSPEQKLLIMSVAAKAEKKLETLLDEKKVFEIAEEFANGGIDTLYSWVFEEKDHPVKVMDREISRLVKKGNYGR